MSLKKPLLYFAFGLSVESDWPLPCDSRLRGTWGHVRLQTGDDEFFAANVPAALRRPDRSKVAVHDLENGARYLLWRDVFEFHLSSDSHLVVGRNLDGRPEAAFQTYLLGHLFAYIVLGAGLETTHAATMVMDGQAVAFLGDSTYGKSTLAAGLLRMGHTLMSDDFLVIRRKGSEYWAYPGMPRIKLYEKVARELIPEHRKGWPMFEGPDPKFIYPVHDMPLEPLPISRFYDLAAPQLSHPPAGVTLATLNQREAYLALTRNAFNVRITSPYRLRNQFEWATEIVRKVPVKQLSYPRTFAAIQAVEEVVRLDLKNHEKSLLTALPARNR